MNPLRKSIRWAKLDHGCACYGDFAPYCRAREAQILVGQTTAERILKLQLGLSRRATEKWKIFEVGSKELPIAKHCLRKKIQP